MRRRSSDKIIQAADNMQGEATATILYRAFGFPKVFFVVEQIELSDKLSQISFIKPASILFSIA